MDYPVPNSVELIIFNESILGKSATTLQSQFNSLPPEITVKIFKYAGLASRINLAMSSKHLAKTATTNAVLSIRPTALVNSDIEMLREIIPLKIARGPFSYTHGELPVRYVECLHCRNEIYAALELAGQRFWMGTTIARDLRKHLKADLEVNKVVAALNIKDMLHLIRGFVCYEKAEYERKLNRTAFLTLKLRKVN